MIPARSIVDHRGRPIVAKLYEGAGAGRRTSNWVAPATGPNRALSYNLGTLRNRARAADRNNPWLWQAIDRLVSNEVGVGVTLRSTAKDKDFRDAVNALWQRSRNELDPTGLLNFGGLQAQMVRSRRVAGEVFIRRRRRRVGVNGLAVPIQIQVLESDFAPIGYSKDLPNGNYVRDAIEYNQIGGISAYWLYRSHPTDDGPTRFYGEPVRVPAADVIHHYMPARPGQRRGEPNAVRSLLGAHTFDSYEDAELVRKQTRAPLTGAIYREAYSDQDWKFDPFTGAPIGGEESPVVDVEPGTFLGLAPGERVDLFKADDNGAGMAEYARHVLMKISAGFGVPYEVMSGDWSKVNDRLVRAILNEFHRAIESAQDHLLIHQVCLGVWTWWMDSAVFSGLLRPADYANTRHERLAVQARPHGWKYVNPSQDIDAKIKALSARLTSRQEIRDEMPGASLEEIYAQIEEDPAPLPDQSTDNGGGSEKDEPVTTLSISPGRRQ